ncbi:ParB/RepB/Spo0J family partition protein [Salmonella enterica subsp. enterica serovar Infantis]|nr:ParB/RepB/Spo0J family partition protein [Salmonella enterica subsp. enterica serovar Infantis]EGI5923882.1 ParB/RepB/Spo0J family partition protein [Salmonella enterica subsp. enterica serovar Colindale]
MSKRPTIGRQLNSQIAAEVLTSAERTQFFTLKTGRKAKFTFYTVPAQKVADKTYVKQETNGRDQSALTKYSLKDIIKTIKFQQFFPCIGVWEDNKTETIEILDGSRRRAAAIFAHTPLDVMVTSEPLSADEARQLAKDIQTAKEHNLREVGVRLLSLKEAGLSQKEIAEQEGISQSKVTRAMQAASVPQELVSLFPVQSELSLNDYRALLELSETFNDKGIEFSQLIETISNKLDSIIANVSYAEDERKSAILRLITQSSVSLIAAPVKDKPVISSLWSFEDKDRFARKRVKGRTFTYEFNRLSKEIQQDLDQAIENVLNRHLKS